MARYDGGWAPYVPVAERRRRAERAMAKLRKTGHPVAPVTIAGRVIATTFWGRAWCDNLESYRDYESRLPRGRTYVRNGSVVDLQIAPGRISATVSGSELYTVTITIKEAAPALWRAICADCTGGVASLVELLQGRLSKGVMERLCRQQGGLFPRPSEIRFTCSCPDHAAMCKHVAAAVYGVGARLDQQPELLFRLRAVDANDLLAGAGDTRPLLNAGAGVGRMLQTDDMAALFGLDMAATETPATGMPTIGTPRTGTPRTGTPAGADQPAPSPKRRGSAAATRQAAAARPGTADPRTDTAKAAGSKRGPATLPTPVLAPVARRPQSIKPVETKAISGRIVAQNAPLASGKPVAKRTASSPAVARPRTPASAVAATAVPKPDARHVRQTAGGRENTKAPVVRKSREPKPVKWW